MRVEVRLRRTAGEFLVFEEPDAPRTRQFEPYLIPLVNLVLPKFCGRRSSATIPFQIGHVAIQFYMTCLVQTDDLSGKYRLYRDNFNRRMPA